jgi:hypothetical protein
MSSPELPALRPNRRLRRSLAIVLCLVPGLIFSEAAPSFAVSGLSAEGSAACAQYPQRCDDDPDDSQPRVPVRSGDLPFTGSASLLILGLGGVLLVTGAVLRPRARSGDDE